MSTFGKMIEISLFGESHGEAIGITIHHFPAGVEADLDHILLHLALRRGLADISTTRNEQDAFSIISGLFNGKTTGAPLTFLVPNTDVISHPYEANHGIVRPSHADLTQYLKYHGANDYRGGGHLSGRLTAPLVILGSLCDQCLKAKGISIRSRIKSIGTLEDSSSFDIASDDISQDQFPVLDSRLREEMVQLVKAMKAGGDSVGGTVETIITNLPAGLGEPFFDSVESIISHLIFSIPGVKGIEFGDGFAITQKTGGQANDQMAFEGDHVKYLTNHSGGINGGITNGAPVVFRTAIKPTPSIAKKQLTVNMSDHSNTETEIRGRHDPCIVPRALPVINALTSYAILELIERNQYDV